FRYFSKTISAALVVAILEEIIFRGGLFGALRKAYSWKIALVSSSVVYALVHFLSKAPAPPSIHWLSGFVTLGHMLRGFGDWQMLIPGFFNLTLAGIILAMAYQFSGTLYFSIGLHGGWIFWLKSYGFFTSKNMDQESWFWGTQKLIDGWAAFIVLVLTLLILIWCQRKLFPEDLLQRQSFSEQK
ncbi:MAG: CPBP family intramembrane metalloprotease, partial [Verrucomicrobiota bacterium]|nr:CPBP family intramembrane metalloprotease [Verrucomicrobiota bacterium]